MPETASPEVVGIDSHSPDSIPTHSSVPPYTDQVPCGYAGTGSKNQHWSERPNIVEEPEPRAEGQSTLWRAAVQRSRLHQAPSVPEMRPYVGTTGTWRANEYTHVAPPPSNAAYQLERGLLINSQKHQSAPEQHPPPPCRTTGTPTAPHLNHHSPVRLTHSYPHEHQAHLCHPPKHEASLARHCTLQGGGHGCDTTMSHTPHAPQAVSASF